MLRGSRATVDPAVLTELAGVCRDAERLRFEYENGEGAPSRRTVEPHRLVCTEHRWYLVAWDLDRADWRSFRVDRLTDPAPTGARFRPRDIPGGDPVAWLRSRIAAIPTRYDVSVTLAATPAQVKAVVGHWGTVEPLPADPSVLAARPVRSCDPNRAFLSAAGPAVPHGRARKN